MKPIILLWLAGLLAALVIILMSGCSPAIPYRAPVPRIGMNISEYKKKRIVEETEGYIKWWVQTGECMYCFFYVTCDHDGKILATWGH